MLIAKSVKWAIVILALQLLACTKIYNSNPVSPTPTPQPSDVTKNVSIEYRVTGTVPLVNIRYSNSNDGLNQVTTSLPWSAKVLTPANSDLFISLEVAATDPGVSTLGSVPFITAQIFVDGILLREASSSGSVPILVTATYKK